MEAKLKKLILAVGLVLAFAIPSSAQDNWFASGIVTATVQAPITAGQVLVDGRQNDQNGGFLEEVDVMLAASTTAFVAVQKIGADGMTVVHSQPLQVGLGASPFVHFHVVMNQGEHLRIVNVVQIVAGAIAVSFLYTN